MSSPRQYLSFISVNWSTLTEDGMQESLAIVSTGYGVRVSYEVIAHSSKQKANPKELSGNFHPKGHNRQIAYGVL